MRLTWEQTNGTGQSLEAMDGRRLVGQVVVYDRPAGWQAFIHGHRISGGPWPSAEPAQRALEVSWAQHSMT